MGTLRFREAMPLAQVQVSSPLLLVLQPAVASSPMLSIHRMHQSPEGTGGLVRMQISRTHPREFWVETRNLRFDCPGDSDERSWPHRLTLRGLELGWGQGGREVDNLILSALRGVSPGSQGFALRA